MFLSCSLHISIEWIFTIRQKRIRGGGGFPEGNSAPLKQAGCCYEYTIVSVPRMARPYTILSAACQTRTCTRTHTHTVYTELDGGRQAGREEAGKERGRMEGGREQGEGGREQEEAWRKR